MTDHYHFVTLRVSTASIRPDEPDPLGDGMAQLVAEGRVLEVEVVSAVCEVTQGRTWPAPHRPPHSFIDKVTESGRMQYGYRFGVVPEG